MVKKYSTEERIAILKRNLWDVPQNAVRLHSGSILLISEWPEYYSGSFSVMDFIIGCAREPRFASQIHQPIKVLDHLLYCASSVHPKVPLEIKQMVLIHDLHEGIVKDLPSPVKLMADDYKEFEARFFAFMLEQLNLTDLKKYSKHEWVKNIDRKALEDEYMYGFYGEDNPILSRIVGMTELKKITWYLKLLKHYNIIPR